MTFLQQVARLLAPRKDRAVVAAAALFAGVAALGRVTGSAPAAPTGEETRRASATVAAPGPAACGATGSGVCRYVDAVAGNDGNPGDKIGRASCRERQAM